MRYIVNSKNYVVAISFGTDMVYNDCVCTEYTGRVPSGWNSLEEWHEDEGEKLWRWKIVAGNLTLDSSAKAPEEGRWGVPKLYEGAEFIPGASQKTYGIPVGYDGYGKITVKGDGDLVPENIANDAEIFGVAGTAQRGYVGLCTAGDHQSYADITFEGLNGRIPSRLVMFGLSLDGSPHSGEDICFACPYVYVEGGASPAGYFCPNGQSIPSQVTTGLSLIIPDPSNRDKLRLTVIGHHHSFHGVYLCVAVC